MERAKGLNLHVEIMRRKVHFKNRNGRLGKLLSEIISHVYCYYLMRLNKSQEYVAENGILAPSVEGCNTGSSDSDH